MAITLSTSYQLVAQKYLGNSAGNVYIRAYAKYSSQDVVNNKTKGVTVQLRVYYDGSWITCGVWKFTGYGNYYSSSQAVNAQNDIVQGSHSSADYTFYNGETTIATSAGIDVAHASNGTKSISIGCWGSFTSWGWEGSSGSVTVNLPSIDRSAPTITATVTPISATQISVSATSNVASSDFKAYVDGSTTGIALTVASNGLSASGTLTVSEGTHTVYVSAKKNSNNVVGSSSSVSVTTKVPIVNFSVTNITTDSITVSATSDVATTAWGFSSDGGTSYATPTVSTATTTQSYTFTGLAINTDYSIKVRVQNPSNNLYGVSATSTAKTQGGILHVKVGNTWKDALAYVKVGNSWKQAIVYTKVGNSWRIGT